ncbi:MAG: indole-3-glycerol phosphate synthase TrpC [Actinobacteria bacterium]|nr:indole-3-glycerol phosphate synthase TrpC [Actinomycetota bacterium]
MKGPNTAIKDGSPGHPGETYLDRIVPAVLVRLEERKRELPLSALEASIDGTGDQGRRLSFVESIAADGVSLIAEIKRASPSKGPIWPDLEVGPLVMAYERAGARAISVLTEQDYFKGSLEDLCAAVAATSLPVLRKDFIVDVYQIYEARAAGASAVLLIAALLSDVELRTLAALAEDLDLAVLLEVHDAQELARALRFPGVVIGVNNRDLRTFEVSLQTTCDLARLVPTGRLLIGESGIRTNDDLRMLKASGVDGVLVGETLLRSPDVETAIRDLIQGG